MLLTGKRDKESTEKAAERCPAYSNHTPCFEPLIIEIHTNEWFEADETTDRHLTDLQLEGFSVISSQQMEIRIGLETNNIGKTEIFREDPNFCSEIKITIKEGTNYIGWLPSVINNCRVTITPEDEKTTVRNYTLVKTGYGEYRYALTDTAEAGTVPWKLGHPHSLITMEKDIPLMLVDKMIVHTNTAEYNYYMSLELPTKRKQVWKYYITLDTSAWWGNRRTKKGIHTEWGWYGHTHKQTDHGSPNDKEIDTRHKPGKWRRI